MSIPARADAASGGPPRLSVVETEMVAREPFTVEVRRRRHVAIVAPRGELELATAQTLRSALDGAIAEPLSENVADLVLDLRGLSFIDSTGLHLLVALDERARRDGFRLTLLAPPAPADRAIQLCGLDKTLPFAAPDAVGSEALRDVT